MAPSVSSRAFSPRWRFLPRLCDVVPFCITCICAHPLKGPPGATAGDRRRAEVGAIVYLLL